MKVLVLILSFLTPVLVSADTESKPVPFRLNYDAKTNQLSLNTEGAMLKGILGSLTMGSGIATYMDPKADTAINIKFDNLPIAKAIDRLCKTLNCVVRYEEDEKTKKSFIVGLELLPTGKERSGNLPSIVPMMGELSIHARNHQAPEIFGFIQKRLEARFNRLPPVQREQMLESYQRKIDDAKERTAEREKRKQEREDRRAARETRRAQRDEELRLNNPARYELMMQRREEVRMNAQNGN